MNFIRHIADGVKKAFEYTFQVMKSADLHVSLDYTPQHSGYTVEGIGNQTGGTVHFEAPPIAESVVRLFRKDTPTPLLALDIFGGHMVPRFAELMWEAGGRQIGRDLDYWSASQKQVFDTTEAIQAQLRDLPEKALSPAVMVSHLREHMIPNLAYLIWEAGGRQLGQHVDNWLAAENQILENYKSAQQEVLHGVGDTVTILGAATRKSE